METRIKFFSYGSTNHIVKPTQVFFNKSRRTLEKRVYQLWCLTKDISVIIEDLNLPDTPKNKLNSIIII